MRALNREVNKQLDRVDNAISLAVKSVTQKDIIAVLIEYYKLRTLLGRYKPIMKNGWEVTVFTSTNQLTTTLDASDLDDAQAKANHLVDVMPDVTRYELYCDGILIPEN